MEGAVRRLMEFDPRYADEYETQGTLDLSDEDRAKALRLATVYRNAFSTKDGKEVLDHMISTFLIGSPPVDLPQAADRRLGQEDVVKQILQQFHLAEELQSNGFSE